MSQANITLAGPWGPKQRKWKKSYDFRFIRLISKVRLGNKAEEQQRRPISRATALLGWLCFLF